MMGEGLKPNHGLGRRPAPDPRDQNFMLRALVPEHRTKAQIRKLDRDQQKALDRGWRYWNAGRPYLNQGPFPHCVGYAWAHWLAAGPVTQRDKLTNADGDGIYKLAQRLDEWPGENYAGTSVRGGAKALVQLGYVGEYRWAWKIEEVIEALLLVGPVVFGTDWFEGMDLGDNLDDRRAIMRASGSVLGGHAYLIVGVNLKLKRFAIKNSWGQRWADRGRAWLPFEDADRLLANYGEACLATEIKRQ